MKYDVSVMVNIREKHDDQGYARSLDTLSFHNSFEIEGDSFSAIAPRIDAVVAAAKGAEQIMSAPHADPDS